MVPAGWAAAAAGREREREREVASLGGEGESELSDDWKTDTSLAREECRPPLRGEWMSESSLPAREECLDSLSRAADSLSCARASTSRARSTCPTPLRTTIGSEGRRMGLPVRTESW
jgi:hypothetical protein